MLGSSLTVIFSVMWPGELIRRKETKAILFAESRDANLFWLVILRRGLFAAAVGFQARSNSPSSGATLVSVRVRIGGHQLYQSPTTYVKRLLLKRLNIPENI